MANNTTYPTNTSSDAGWSNEIITAINVLKINRMFVIVVGTLINVWFLAAILTSREMRSRLRNKIICNTFIVHLLDSAFILPFKYARGAGRFRNAGCIFYSVFDNLQRVQDFIANWLVVILIAIFIAQIRDFDPSSRLVPKAVKVGTFALLVFPWVLSVTIVPSIVYDYFKRDSYLFCFVPRWSSLEVFRSIDTAIPVILAVLLLVVAAVLRYRHFTQRSSSDSIQTELISRGLEIDNIWAYITAVITLTACDVLIALLDLNKLSFREFITRIQLYVAGVILSEARIILMPFSWLLLPEIRQRIKTWRPWHRASPGIDLTMTYRKEEN